MTILPVSFCTPTILLHLLLETIESSKSKELPLLHGSSHLSRQPHTTHASHTVTDIGASGSEDVRKKEVEVVAPRRGELVTK